MTSQLKVIDGDGHVLEDVAAIAQFMPKRYQDWGRLIGAFPALDHFHCCWVTDSEVTQEFMLERPPGRAREVGPAQWLAFMEATGMESAVLYPTAGLACGKLRDPYFRVVAVRAYNDWLREHYMGHSPRFKGMGLLPIDNADEAVRELRRVVEELDMCGAMLPSNGMLEDLGAQRYWPIYEEAQRLGCCLAIHGGCHDNLGLDGFNNFPAFHALGHPFSIMRGFASMLFAGVFDRFTELRVGFLEAGAAWFLTVAERAHGSHNTFKAHDPEGRFINLSADRTVSRYIERLVRQRNIFVGVEGEEPCLAYAVRAFGAEPFIFSSDYPHETDAKHCREEIEEVLEAGEINQAQKEAILRNNSKYFYRI